MMDYYSNREPICPHCDKEVGIDDNELYHLYDTDDNNEIECPYCEKSFWVQSIVMYRFSTNKENDF